MSGDVRRAIDDARALLSELVASRATSVHVASSGVEVFITRGSDPSPLLAPAAAAGCDAPAPVQGPEHTVTAPHVGTLDWIVAAGQSVEAGQAVVRLRVLDLCEDVTSDRAGTVARANAAVGDLVEYGQSLVALAAL